MLSWLFDIIQKFYRIFYDFWDLVNTFLASIAISVSPGAGAVLSMNYGINYGLKNHIGQF